MSDAGALRRSPISIGDVANTPFVLGAPEVNDAVTFGGDPSAGEAGYRPVANPFLFGD